ncbi:class I SAM-dependent methyltransferase [Motiliproteus sediminis]|uniref:class I SAM-dependent methyltransferase n=1 Tax=Motiliproteus sediminis TaxID=1468178 RepID=UPI001AEFAD8E|nr:methyltransferase domain-containing protein [Motiliproteus sediminis]
MSDADRQRWNARYSNAAATEPSPCQTLVDYAHLLPAGGHALDLACGRGGNALFVARRGLCVEAWDIAANALAHLQHQADNEALSLSTVVADLDQTPLPEAGFDLITVSGFLNRALCPAISAALRPGGVLLYQTFTQQRPDAGSGPSNPAYTLEPGELLHLFAELELLLYREERDAGELTRGLRNQAALIARRTR